jgi:hypothetical protein
MKQGTLTHCKQVILLTSRLEDIPFDLKNYPHIVYEGRIVRLRPELRSWLEWAIANPERRLTSAEPNIELYSEGKKLSDNPIITLYDQLPSTLQVDIYNPGPGTVGGNINLALINADFEGYQSQRPTVRLPDGQLLVPLGPLPTIFPKSWGSVTARLEPVSSGGTSFPGVIRVITEVSTKDVFVLMQF